MSVSLTKRVNFSANERLDLVDLLAISTTNDDTNAQIRKAMLVDDPDGRIFYGFSTTTVPGANNGFVIAAAAGVGIDRSGNLLFLDGSSALSVTLQVNATNYICAYYQETTSDPDVRRFYNAGVGSSLSAQTRITRGTNLYRSTSTYSVSPAFNFPQTATINSVAVTLLPLYAVSVDSGNNITSIKDCRPLFAMGATNVYETLSGNRDVPFTQTGADAATMNITSFRKGLVALADRISNIKGLPWYSNATNQWLVDSTTKNVSRTGLVGINTVPSTTDNTVPLSVGQAAGASATYFTIGQNGINITIGVAADNTPNITTPRGMVYAFSPGTYVKQSETGDISLIYAETDNTYFSSHRNPSWLFGLKFGNTSSFYQSANPCPADPNAVITAHAFGDNVPLRMRNSANIKPVYADFATFRGLTVINSDITLINTAQSMGMRWGTLSTDATTFTNQFFVGIAQSGQYLSEPVNSFYISDNTTASSIDVFRYDLKSKNITIGSTNTSFMQIITPMNVVSTTTLARQVIITNAAYTITNDNILAVTLQSAPQQKIHTQPDKFRPVAFSSNTSTVNYFSGSVYGVPTLTNTTYGGIYSLALTLPPTGKLYSVVVVGYGSTNTNATASLNRSGPANATSVSNTYPTTTGLPGTATNPGTITVTFNPAYYSGSAYTLTPSDALYLQLTFNAANQSFTVLSVYCNVAVDGIHTWIRA